MEFADRESMSYDGKKGVDNVECVVPLPTGEYLIFESYAENPNGTSYVRFADKDRNELLYYTSDEWHEEPQLVMGCIMAAIQNGAKNAKDRNPR